MSIVERNLPINMTRANLEHLPEFVLPEGFSIRWYQPGDEEHWLRIHRAADRFNEITPGLFYKQFGLAGERGLQTASARECQSGMKSALQHLRERQCYLLDTRGHAVGTGTAWFNDSFQGAKFGRVHWMAIVPAHQGRGLAKPLMTTVCRRLRELGHDRAYLSTSTARLAAINLYLHFGFVPLVRNEEEASAWRELRKALVDTGRADPWQMASS